MDRWRGQRLNPFRELTDLQTEIDEAFNAYFGVRPRTSAPERTWAPPIDVWVSTLRTCAGMSSGPSAVCTNRGSPSGARSAMNVSRSRRTSGSAFSQIISDALVCVVKT